MSERVLNFDAVIRAIDDEPELPGDMPVEPRAKLKRVCESNDIDALTALLRAAVRVTKSGIKERIFCL